MKKTPVFRLALATLPLGLLAAAACVGDDPAASSATTSDGGVGVETGSPSDSGGSPDTSTADTGTDASSAFGPGKLAGLVLWLDAQDDATFTAAGGTVTAWHDKSSASNDAVGISALEPARVANATLGKQVVRFTNENKALVVKDKSDLYFHDTDDFLVATVMSFTHAGQGGFLQKIAANKGLGFFTVTTNEVCFALDSVCGAGNSLKDAGLSGTFHTYIVRRTDMGTKLHLAIDGVEVGVRTYASAVDVSAPAADIVLGAETATDAGATYGMDGDLAEVVVAHGAATDADVTALHGYFKTKWGL